MSQPGLANDNREESEADNNRQSILEQGYPDDLLGHELQATPKLNVVTADSASDNLENPREQDEEKNTNTKSNFKTESETVTVKDAQTETTPSAVSTVIDNDGPGSDDQFIVQNKPTIDAPKTQSQTVRRSPRMIVEGNQGMPLMSTVSRGAQSHSVSTNLSTTLSSNVNNSRLRALLPPSLQLPESDEEYPDLPGDTAIYDSLAAVSRVGGPPEAVTVPPKRNPGPSRVTMDRLRSPGPAVPNLAQFQSGPSDEYGLHCHSQTVIHSSESDPQNQLTLSLGAPDSTAKGLDNESDDEYHSDPEAEFITPDNPITSAGPGPDSTVTSNHCQKLAEPPPGTFKFSPGESPVSRDSLLDSDAQSAPEIPGPGEEVGVQTDGQEDREEVGVQTDGQVVIISEEGEFLSRSSEYPLAVDKSLVNTGPETHVDLVQGNELVSEELVSEAGSANVATPAGKSNRISANDTETSDKAATNLHINSQNRLGSPGSLGSLDAQNTSGVTPAAKSDRISVVVNESEGRSTEPGIKVDISTVRVPLLLDPSTRGLDARVVLGASPAAKSGQISENEQISLAENESEGPKPSNVKDITSSAIRPGSLDIPGSPTFGLDAQNTLDATPAAKSSQISENPNQNESENLIQIASLKLANEKLAISNEWTLKENRGLQAEKALLEAKIAGLTLKLSKLEGARPSSDSRHQSLSSLERGGNSYITNEIISTDAASVCPRENPNFPEKKNAISKLPTAISVVGPLLSDNHDTSTTTNIFLPGPGPIIDVVTVASSDTPLQKIQCQNNSNLTSCVDSNEITIQTPPQIDLDPSDLKSDIGSEVRRSRRSSAREASLRALNATSAAASDSSSDDVPACRALEAGIRKLLLAGSEATSKRLSGPSSSSTNSNGRRHSDNNSTTTNSNRLSNSNSASAESGAGPYATTVVTTEIEVPNPGPNSIGEATVIPVTATSFFPKLSAKIRKLSALSTSDFLNECGRISGGSRGVGKSASLFFSSKNGKFTLKTLKPGQEVNLMTAGTTSTVTVTSGGVGQTSASYSTTTTSQAPGGYTANLANPLNVDGSETHGSLWNASTTESAVTVNTPSTVTNTGGPLWTTSTTESSSSSENILQHAAREAASGLTSLGTSIGLISSNPMSTGTSSSLSTTIGRGGLNLISSRPKVVPFFVDYCNHVARLYDRTLLPMFYLVMKIEFEGRSMHVVVMKNVFYSEASSRGGLNSVSGPLAIHERYDLKGSLHNRFEVNGAVSNLTDADLGGASTNTTGTGTIVSSDKSVLAQSQSSNKNQITSSKSKISSSPPVSTQTLKDINFIADGPRSLNFLYSPYALQMFTQRQHTNSSLSYPSSTSTTSTAFRRFSTLGSLNTTSNLNSTVTTKFNHNESEALSGDQTATTIALRRLARAVAEGPHRGALQQALKTDSTFLSKWSLMDYSLLLGIHFYPVEDQGGTLSSAETGPPSTGAVVTAATEPVADRANESFSKNVSTPPSSSNSTAKNVTVTGGVQDRSQSRVALLSRSFESKAASILTSSNATTVTVTEKKNSPVAVTTKVPEIESQENSSAQESQKNSVVQSTNNLNFFAPLPLSLPEIQTTAQSNSKKKPSTSTDYNIWAKGVDCLHITVNGTPSTNQSQKIRRCRLFLGIVDILQPYDHAKFIEHLWKAGLLQRSVSSVDPDKYRERFCDFLFGKVFRGDADMTLALTNTAASAASTTSLNFSMEFELMRVWQMRFMETRFKAIRRLDIASNSSNSSAPKQQPAAAAATVTDDGVESSAKKG